MKLLHSPTSPYSSKVRMAARYLGVSVEEIKVAAMDDPVELVECNPLGKIPTLVSDEGQAIFDSRAIMHYLHRVSGGSLYPKKEAKRTDVEVFEALCDGITDCLVAIVYEKRFHPPEKVHQPYIDRQWSKVVRGLDHLNAHIPKTGKKLNGGHFAMAAMIGYLMLRFPGEWEDGRTELTAWPQKFAKRFEDYSALKPQG